MSTVATPASEVEAVIQSPTNMATADTAAVDFNKMTSKRHHSTGGLFAAMFVGEDLVANRRLQTLPAVVIGRKKSREYLI